MRRPTLTIVVFLGTLVGCAEAPTAPAHDPLAAQFAASDRPFQASCELAIQPPTPVGPGMIRQLDVGECVIAHLGRTTMVSDKVINFIAGTQTLDATFTAANGDVLRATGTGTNTMVAPGRVAFEASITFTGGTGRFADATGHATITGEADIVNGRSRMTATGSIAY